MAIKVMGPIWRGTPTRGLEVICNIRPLELELRKLAAEQYLRTKDFHVVPSSEMKTKVESRVGHRQWCENFLQLIGFNMDTSKVDRIPAKKQWEKSYHIDHNSMKSKDPRIRGEIQHHLDGIKIFTDGSLNPKESTNCGTGNTSNMQEKKAIATISVRELFSWQRSTESRRGPSGSFETIE